MPLTDLQIRKFKPQEKRYEVMDDDGLALRIHPSGTKSWSLRYLFDGEPKRLALGHYPAVSLAHARERQALAMKDIENKIDPMAAAREAKAKRKTAPTFKDLLDEFWQEELQHTPTAKERRRLIEKDALPSWTKKMVATITRRDAVMLIDEVRKRAPVGANRLQGVLVRMFNFASERGMIEFSPLAGMRRAKEKSRSRVLTDAEIKILWKALDPERLDIDIYRLTKLALRTILLTGQRPGEVAKMTWDQIEDGQWWNIPAENMKGREAMRVPINAMLAATIEEAKVLKSDESPYVFRSTHKDKAPVTVGAMANSLRRHREEMKIEERFTPHDLRRTLRTRLAELGVSDIVAERVLGHKLQGVLGIYNRHSYDTEKRHALGLWERRLAEILGLSGPAANIIPFEVRHAGN